ncbi:MAG: hypothetical protein KUG82_21600 [Pseudomonadales bacterium]|nr:hypothetical protein [Pseudomonadales bacterium]
MIRQVFETARLNFGAYLVETDERISAFDYLKVYLQGAYEKYERDAEGDCPPTDYQVVTNNGENWLKYSQATDPELIP